MASRAIVGYCARVIHGEKFHRLERPLYFVEAATCPLATGGGDVPREKLQLADVQGRKHAELALFCRKYRSITSAVSK